MKITKNFRLEEFNCRDGTSVPSEFVPNVIELCANLQILRDYLQVPIHINSGYRTEYHNHMVGGAEHSQHLLAKAADITCRDFTPAQVADTIELLIREGHMKNGGLGRYRGFTHYDVRNDMARWGSNV